MLAFLSVKLNIDGESKEGDTFAAIFEGLGEKTKSIKKMEIVEGDFLATDYCPADVADCMKRFVALESFTTGAQKTTEVPANAFSEHLVITEITLTAGTIRAGAIVTGPNVKLTILNSDVTIEDGAFNPKGGNIAFVGDTLTTFKSAMFTDCAKVTSISLNALPTFDATTFTGFAALEQINLDSITEVPAAAFKNLKALTTVSFAKVAKLNAEAFATTEKLTEITLPELTELAGDAHFQESKLVKFSAPKLTTVDSQAKNIFLKCVLTDITLGAVPPKTFAKDTFATSPEVALHLPAEGDYATYDSNTDVEGDIADDRKWCGITLPPVPTPEPQTSAQETSAHETSAHETSAHETSAHETSAQESSAVVPPDTKKKAFPTAIVAGSVAGAIVVIGVVVAVIVIRRKKSSEGFASFNEALV